MAERIYRTVVSAGYHYTSPTTIDESWTTLDCGHIAKGASHFALSKPGDKVACWHCDQIAKSR